MIQSENILLRALEPEDVDLLYQWENDMNLWVVSNTLAPFSKHQLKEYIKNSKLDLYQTKQLRLVIENAQNQGNAIGLIDLFDFDPYHNRAGIGIVIHNNFRQKGWASDALDVFIQYCFDYLGIHQLYANITEHNLASIALFEGLGFSLAGRKEDWRKTPKGYEAELLYQKINK